eukprot:TRINITY_DN11_c0_g5_i1.p2 TRINITY_DN11_c0_g5~~TRINITY_DN11_c0_g5_i1.p2  ORF type:complete len:415 (-),score=81.46 TRINITY_DN11_c0_g5_i1:761-2005(-)
MAESTQTGEPLGGFATALAELDSVPAFLAALAFVLAALQGVLCLESVDSCRLSRRKMNILLAFEAVETLVLFCSELLSFLELRDAFDTAFPSLQFVAPCLFAAGVLQTFSELYFTLAVVTKSRILWMPISNLGSRFAALEIAPLTASLLLSVTLIGWRFRWWFRADAVAAEQALSAIQNEPSLAHGVMAFAAGWTVAISGSLVVIMLLSDCGEDGPSYFASVRYLWSPEKWIEQQHTGTKLWYRHMDSAHRALDEYVACALLDDSVPVPRDTRHVQVLLERGPLHVGNAIVGSDKQFCKREDRTASHLHKVVLLAEHLVVLPLLVVIVVIIARNHQHLDHVHYEALRQLAEGAIVLAFIEFAIGAKNVLWGVSGTSRRERAKVSGEDRLSHMRGLPAFSAEVEGGCGDMEIKVE